MVDVAAPGTAGERPLLRFGVLVDREGLSRWEREVVKALLDGGDAELALVVHGSDPTPSPRDDRFSLWRLYNNGLVARRARAIAPVGRWDEFAQGVPRLDALVERRGKWSQHFRPADLDALRSANLDFLFRFGLGIIRGEVLTVPRYGVWSYHHDDERVIRGGPPSFWEVYDGLPTSGVLLQRLTDRLDGGIPLSRANFRTVLHSYPRNRDRALLGAAMLPARAARAVRLGLLDPDTIPLSPSTAPVRYNPTDRQVLRVLGSQIRRSFATTTRSLTHADIWAIGVASGPVVSDGRCEIGAVEWIPEQRTAGYMADPFVATWQGKTAILVEDYDEPSNRGTISALERVGSGWKLHRDVIDPGVHASYPFLLEHDGNLYCIPETWQARRVEAWRCVEFPTRWERSAVLIEGVPAVDSTVLYHEGRWWLFATRRDDEPDTKLHLWHAEGPLGPWTPHKLNPVKIDVSSSRPAGPPFVLNGELYRPAQDCSTSYGSAVVLNRVRALGDEGLDEEPLGPLEMPGGPYASGTHTLSNGGGLWVVDGRRYGFDRHRFMREAMARLRLSGRRG
jgi:hypothetical protein